MRSVLSVLTAAVLFGQAPPCPAQSLSSRPAIFADPLLTSDPTQGDLVLGRTSLAAALRIFAVELRDSVRMPLGHASNPDTVLTSSVIGLPSTPKAFYRLDLGPARYTLYFDKHERLVAATASRSQFPRTLRREDLVARYASLRVQSTGRSADQRRVLDWVVAELAPCVVMSASVWYGDDGLRDERHILPGTVLELGYVYTCATSQAPVKAVVDWYR